MTIRPGITHVQIVADWNETDLEWNCYIKLNNSVLANTTRSNSNPNWQLVIRQIVDLFPYEYPAHVATEIRGDEIEPFETEPPDNTPPNAVPVDPGWICYDYKMIVGRFDNGIMVDLKERHETIYAESVHKATIKLIDQLNAEPDAGSYLYFVARVTRFCRPDMRTGSNEFIYECNFEQKTDRWTDEDRTFLLKNGKFENDYPLRKDDVDRYKRRFDGLLS